MKTLITFYLLLLSLNLAVAQQDEPVDETSDDWKYGLWVESSFLANLAFNASPNIQRFIRQSGDGYSPISPYIFTNTGFRLRNTMLLANAGISVGTSNEQVSQYLSFGGFSLEQTIIKSPRYRFNIGVGYGAYSHRLAVSQREPDRSIDFRDALNERYRQVDFINEGGAFNFSIGLHDRERRTRSLGFSYRLGYHMGNKPKTWEGVSVQFTNAPQDRFGLLYFQGSVMFVRNFKKR